MDRRRASRSGKKDISKINSSIKPRNTLKSLKEESRRKRESEDEPVNPFEVRERQKKRKRKPGANVLQDIRKLQSSSELMLPQSSFALVVREICDEFYDEKVRWTSMAMKALQTSAEDYMVGLFEDSYLCSMHAQRVTLYKKDMQLARRIRGVNDPGNR